MPLFYSMPRQLFRQLTWLLFAVLQIFSVQAASNAWSAVGSLGTARYLHTSTLLPSGKILTAGGYGNVGFNNGYLATTELFDPGTNTWTPAGSLIEGRVEHTANLLPSGKVLIVGGSKVQTVGGFTYTIWPNTELYDPATNTWSASFNLSGRSNHTTTVLPSGKVLVVGGKNSTGAAISSSGLYDPDTNTPLSGRSLATSRYHHTATLLPSGKVLVAGGLGNSGFLDSAELYNPATDTWSSAGTLGTGRYHHTATLLATGKVLVTGGFDDRGILLSAELYDPLTNSWSPAASLAKLRYHHAATLLPSGKVLVSGGSGDGLVNNGYVTTSEVYDPAADVWSTVGSLGLGRSAHTATLLPSGDVLVVGGDGIGGFVAAAELYDSTNWSAISTGSLATARDGHTATVLATGKVLVTGYAASAELYDSSSGTWSAAGSLATQRTFHTSTLLISGKVLVVGGHGGGPALASCELYEPATNSWSTTGSLLTGRYNHTATLLASGKVLVIGGRGSSTLSSAEIYDPATNLWSATGNLSVASSGHTATLLPSGKVLVSGGGLGNGTQLFDPVSNLWSVAGNLSITRSDHTATLLPSGKVLVAGGVSSTGNVASAQLFNPATNTWSATGSLATARSGHSAMLLPSGKVMVSGGASVELFDPATNLWSTIASLAPARTQHTVSLLPSGNVLLAGGYSGGVLASAVLYGPSLGFAESRRPVINGVNRYVQLGDSLQIAGTGLLGDSEASGGATNSSATNYPLLQLRGVENDQVRWLKSASSPTATGFQSEVIAGLPLGAYYATIFVNGIPSQSAVIQLATWFNITTVANPLAGGTVSCIPNPVTYAASSTCTAVPNVGYTFSGFSGDCTGATCVLNNVTAAKNVAASFVVSPAVSLIPTSLTFSSQALGTTSNAKTVTLTNTGNALLTISSMNSSNSQFGVTHNCGASVAAGATCILSVSFSPVATGAATGSITMVSNAPNSPHSVSVTGTGVWAVAPQVAAGGYHSIALKSGSEMMSWGQNLLSQLGDGTDIDRNVPVAVTGVIGIVGAAAGEYHSLARKSDNTVVAWGNNVYGQLGDGTNTGRNSAVAVTGLTGVVSLAAGSNHSLALKSDGTVRAWGLNNFGQLGDGTTSNRNIPVVVTGLTGVVAVAAGRNHSYALKSDGTVVAWGANGNGQLGDGTTTQRNSAVAVNGLNGVVTLAAGGDHGIALKSDGTLVAWGWNYYGQLGDGTTTNRSTPMAVSNLAGVRAVAAGYGHSVALKSDGTVVGWGRNDRGQLGDGTITNRTGPVAVSGLTGVAAVAAGWNHSLALKSDGTVVAWGYNWDGQLGDGTNTDRISPVAISGGLNLGASTTAASLSPGTLIFAARNIGTSSAAQTLTLTNTGSNTLALSFISASGDYARTTTCGSTLAVSATCTISVTFTPTVGGARAGVVSIVSNGIVLQSVALSGTGVVVPQAVSVSPTSLTFVSRDVGTTSAAQTVTLTNSGGATLNIASITASGDFAKTTNCGATLAAAAVCHIAVTFTPTAAGARSGNVVIASDAASSPNSITLSGTGVAVAVPVVSLSPTSLTFATRDVGTTSAAQTVTLSNPGNAVLTLASITASGDFALSHNCGASVAAAGSCTLTVTFTPTAVGLRAGGIVITSNATGSPHAVGLTGTGQSPSLPVCTLTATPPSIKKNATSVLTSSCTNNPTSYSWTGGTCAGITAATCTVTPVITTSYSVTGTNTAGSGTGSATVTVTSGDITPILFLLLFD